MIKTYMITSEKEKIVKNEQIEVVRVEAENNLTTGFVSKTKNYLFSLEEKMKEKLSKVFKKTDYKILIVADENFKEEKPKILKIVILLDRQEKIDFVKNSLTQTNIEYGILRDTIQKNIISEFYAKVREWTNTIQNYLANEFGFSGKTIVEASLYDEELQAFNITCSGKGTSDDIVWIIKEISKAVTLSKNYGFYIEDKFSFVNSYFQR